MLRMLKTEESSSRMRMCGKKQKIILIDRSMFYFLDRAKSADHFACLANRSGTENELFAVVLCVPRDVCAICVNDSFDFRGLGR